MSSDDKPSAAPQYSPDGQWWWDGFRWIRISTGEPSSPTNPQPNKGWASEIPGLIYVPGFRTSTWWRAVSFSLFYCIFGLFTLVSVLDHIWGGALLFGCWIVFAIAVSYAWILRHRLAPFAAAVGVALLSIGGSVTGVVISPTSASQSRGQSSTTPPPVATVPSSASSASTSTHSPSVNLGAVATPSPVAAPAPISLAPPSPNPPSPASLSTPSPASSLPPTQVAPVGPQLPSSGPTSTPASARGATANGSVDVYLSPTGPWIAKLNRSDDSEIESVVYWIRDARNRWRSTQVVRDSPFEAPINWWEGNNSGYEVVTAHVTLRSGKTLKDPGGWHWVDGRHSSPEGSTKVLLNSDGSASASYAPTLHSSVIKHVDFWLRTAADHWTDAGTATVAQSGAYLVPRLKGTDTYGWNGTDTAVSVHVGWPNGAEFVDPDPWVWSSDFVPASAPPTSQPISTPPPPPTAAPIAPPAPTTAPAGCYPLTNSGKCYEPGEYCRNSDHGMTGRAGDGESIICRFNNGWRWEPF